MASMAKTRRMNVETEVVIEKVDEPQTQEDIIYKDDMPQHEKKKLLDEEKVYISNLIERGFHHKDIMKKANAHLKTDKSVLKELFANVRRVSDIITNMEKM